MGNLSVLIEAHKFQALLRDAVDPKVCVTELLRLKNQQGKPFFVYIRVKPSEYKAYRAKLDRGEMIDPNKYEILEYDWGDPSESLQRVMMEKHGVDHEYENKIRQMFGTSPKKLQAVD